MRNPFIDKLDNCLLCGHADIKDNAIADLCDRIGLKKLAKWFSQFVVVTCRLNNRYVANPLIKPKWCRKHGGR
jgi:hypothetical protein